MGIAVSVGSLGLYRKQVGLIPQENIIIQAEFLDDVGILVLIA